MTKIIQNKLAILADIPTVLKNWGAMDTLMYNALEPIITSTAWHALYDVMNTLKGVSIVRIKPGNIYTRDTIVRINYSNSKSSTKGCNSIW